ncbi:MAG: J domain-containing protein [Brevinematales bacterium]|nr:J domain-containing protein [Brevinematales bacterium]
MASLKEAASVLGLSETFSLEELQQAYRTLLKRYHPDHCQEVALGCEEKTREVIAAYRTLFEAFKVYRVSLEDLETLGPKEFWMKRFASDGVWGNPHPPQKP